MMLKATVVLFSALASAQSQSTLLQAIGNIPSLSNFTAFYRANEPFANLLFGNQSLYPITVLVPNDQAFAGYFQKTGKSLTELTPQQLLPLIQYHTLVSSLGKENFTVPSDGGGAGTGTTVPTLLTEGASNNRSAGPALAAKFGGAQKAQGQVVFVNPAAQSIRSKRFILSSRQSTDSRSSIRSGLSSNVNLTALEAQEGSWAGGRFHIIDGLLTLPDLCSNTIRGAKLSGLDNALNRTGLWPTLDSSKNVTCLGPSDAAFKAAGSPDSALNATDLTKALLFHTLPQVAYSDYLVNGQEFTSIDGPKVRVRIEGTGANRSIYFNNAKVIAENVLTNNGLMHIIDSVMLPLNSSSATPTPSSSSQPTGPANSRAPAPNVSVDWRGWTIVYAVGFFVVADVVGMGIFGLRM